MHAGEPGAPGEVACQLREDRPVPPVFLPRGPQYRVMPARVGEGLSLLAPDCSSP